MDNRQAKIIAYRKAQAKANGEIDISPGFIKGALITLVVIGLVIYGALTSPSDEEWQQIQLETDIEQARDDIQQERQDALRAMQKVHARWIAEQNR